MKLTKQQIDHACGRLNQIAAERIAKATAAIKQPEQVKRLPFNEKYALIASGKAKLRPLGEVSTYTDLTDAYTYPSHEVKFQAGEKVQAKYEADCKKAADPIRKEQQKVLDRIIMSGGEEAVAAIEAFASGK